MSAPNNEVQVIVSAGVGSGKSALLGEIEIMCKALGIPVRYADEKRAQSDKNMNHADWTSELEMYKPSVVLVEDMPWLRDWVSVETRRPTPEVDVLCFDGKSQFVDWFGSKKDCGRGVTHWKPLGSPPAAPVAPHQESAA